MHYKIGTKCVTLSEVALSYLTTIGYFLLTHLSYLRSPPRQTANTHGEVPVGSDKRHLSHKIRAL